MEFANIEGTHANLVRSAVIGQVGNSIEIITFEAVVEVLVQELGLNRLVAFSVVVLQDGVGQLGHMVENSVLEDTGLDVARVADRVLFHAVEHKVVLVQDGRIIRFDQCGFGQEKQFHFVVFNPLGVRAEFMLFHFFHQS